MFREADQRLRGRKGMVQRKRRLAREPLCRYCSDKGLIVAATVPDHIVPLSLGGTDTDANIQCLCSECHAIKTSLEDPSHQGASNHPPWLEPSAIPITIVCGPPCAGKTTYVQERAAPGDEVIDFDAILHRLSPAHGPWQGRPDQRLFNQVIRVRNTLLGRLKYRDRGRAWFIISSPTKAERAWWQRHLGGTVVLLNPGADECRRRAVARGTPAAVDGVAAWMQAASRPWMKKEDRHSVVDADGWPIRE
jgi:5-methylcytosine-specific restriction protein A